MAQLTPYTLKERGAAFHVANVQIYVAPEKDLDNVVVVLPHTDM